jgi:ankyrin repeat protein
VNDAGDEMGRTPVYMAAKNGHAGSIRVLHALGADVNKFATYGVSPIHIAANNGHVACIRVLHELGVNVNMCTSEDISLFYRSSV